MPKLDFDFSEVPDEIKPISPGKYVLEVAKVPEINPAKSGNGLNLVIDFRVTDDGDFKGRAVKDYIFLNEFGLIKAKKLIEGCGKEASATGIDTEELLGCLVNALLVASTFKDSSTGETIANTKVSMYLKA